jgi:hypothetical protein
MLDFDASLHAEVAAQQPSDNIPDALLLNLRESFNEISNGDCKSLDRVLLEILGAVVSAKLTAAQALNIIDGVEFRSSFPASAALVDCIWFWDSQVRAVQMVCRND